MKHTWRQWLWKFLGERRGVSPPWTRARRTRPRVHPTLELLEARTLPSGVFPFVESINRATPLGPATNAASVSYTVNFNEAVTGVAPADFQLATTGTVATTLTQVTPVSGAVYTVTVSRITGNGTLGLNLVDNASIRDLAGDPLTQQNAPAAFQSQTTIATGAVQNHVAVADVNGDGTPDLIVTHGQNNSVGVLLGNGNGTFQSQTTFATGSSPFTMAVGDVNGDGRPDLVVANAGSDTVSVLLGNGNGTFQSQSIIATGSNPLGVAVADVNGDGKPDLIVNNANNNVVGVLLGNGNGTFQSQVNFPSLYSTSVAVEDVNGDGIPDIVATNRQNNSVSVLLGNGDGTFQNAMTFATGASPESVAVADLSGDGKPDLVVANAYLPLPGNGGTVSVLLGNGNGTFQNQTTFVTGLDPFWVAASDVNGDGKPDLVVANRGSNTVGVLLGNGNGTFQNQTTFATGPNPVGVAVADFTGDGRPDLALANFGSDNLSVLLNAGNGNFTGQVYTIVSPAAATHFVISGTPTTVIAGTSFPFTVTAEDQFNETSYAYTGTVHFTSSDSQAVLPANATLISGVGTFNATLKTSGNQTLTATDTATASNTATSGPIAVSPLAATHFGMVGFPNPATIGAAFNFTVEALDPFNNLATGYNGTVHFTSGNTNAVLPAAAPLTAGIGTFSATLLALGSQSLAAVGPIYSGSPTFVAAPGSPFALAANTNTLVTGDFNGDGNLDVLGASAFVDTGYFAISKNNGNATFQLGPTFHSAAEFGAGVIPAVGDFNGDGKLDVAIAGNSLTGPGKYIVVFLGNGDGTFGPSASYMVGNGPTAMVAGDFNGDGKQDLAVINSQDDTMSILLANPNGSYGTTFEPATTYPLGNGPTDIVAGDFNNDGKLDLAVGNSLDNDVEVFLGNGNGTFGAGETFAAGLSPQRIALAEFTRDGNLDIAVNNQSANTVTVLLGNGNGTLKAPATYGAGLDPGAPVAVDINGDGIPDLILTDGGFNELCVLLGNGDGTFRAAPFVSTTVNYSGSTLVAGDFNRDGTPDLAAIGSGGLYVLLNEPLTGTATVQVDPAAATHFTLTTPSTAAAGQPTTVTVTAVDRFGDTATGYTGMVHFTSSDTQALLPADAALVSGTGVFSATFVTAGSQTLTTTDTVARTITGTSPAIAVSPTAASEFTIIGASTATAGSPVKFTVAAFDAFNNTATGYSGTVHFTSTDPAATLPPDSTLMSGTATFSATLTTAGNQTVTANGQLVVVNDSSFAVPALAAGTFQYDPIGSPWTFSQYSGISSNGSAFTSGTANAPDGTQVGLLQMTSTIGQVVIMPAGTYVLTFLAAQRNGDAQEIQVQVDGVTVGQVTPPSTSYSSYQTPSFTVAAAGTHTVEFTGLDPLGGDNTAFIDEVSIVSNVAPGTSNSITVSPAAASHFQVVAASTTITGAATTFTVTALDPFNNIATGYLGTVQFSSTDTAAAFSASSTLASGTGTFEATLQTLGAQTLVATDTAASSIAGSSGTIIVTPIASHFQVIAPAGATGADGFRFTVIAQGVGNLTATNYSGTVHFTSSDSLATLPADAALTNGVGIFAAALRTNGPQTLRATDSVAASLSGTSGPIAVSANPATHFAISGFPNPTPIGTAFTITVEALDSFNNLATGYNGTVTLSSSGSASLPFIATLSAGIATVSATLRTLGSQSITITGPLYDAGPTFVTAPGSPISAISALGFVMGGYLSGGNTFDLVEASGYYGNFVVLLGNGNGTFSPGPSESTGEGAAAGPNSAAIGDFRGDGINDLAFVDNYNHINVCLGNGNGTFGPPATYNVGSDPRAIVAGSFNGSAQDDLAVLNSGDNTITILMANPQGSYGTTFLAPTTTLPTNQAGQLTVGHFTNGGNLDLAVVNTNANDVEVFLGNGNGTFRAGQIFAAGPSPYSIATADLNNNGIDDIVVNNASAGTVSVLMGNGNGTFQSPASCGAGPGPGRPAIADVNGDGIPDIVLNESNQNEVAILLGNGDGTFRPAPFLASPHDDGDPVIVDDFTGQGLPDIVAGLDVYLNQPLTSTTAVIGEPGPASHFTVNTSSTAVAGKPEALTVTAFDQFNNATTNYSGTLSFTSTDSSALFPTNATLVNGTGVFSVTFQTAGTQTLTVADTLTSSISGTIGPITVSGPATHFIVSAPAGVTAGARSITVTVTAQDSLNHTAIGYSGMVTFSSSDTQALLPPNGTLVSGVGLFGVTLKTAGSQTVTATDTVTSTITGASGTVLVSPAITAQFAFSGTPATITAGTPFSFTVTAQDAFNNTTPGYSGSVHFAATDNQAALPANATLTGGTGVFTATLKTAGSQMITAADSIVPTVAGASAAIAVAPTTATHFAISASSAAAAGKAFSFTVSAEDQFNNTATGYAGTLDFTSSDSAATLPGNANLNSGVGTFSATFQTLGSQTLTAADTVSSSVSAASTSMTVFGPATHFFVGAPAGTTAGNSFGVTVTAEDRFNDTALGYNGTIQFASSDSQAIFPANATMTAGVRIFNLTLKSAGSQTLTVADSLSSSISGDSGPIVVSPGLVAHFVFSGIPATATAGTPIAFTVTAQDAFNNTASAYSGTVHFSGSDTLAALPPNTKLTSGSGVVTATLKTAGSQTITAADTVASTLSGISAAFTVAPAAAARFVVNAAPSVTAGNLFVFTVNALDPFNNAATLYNGTVHFTSSDTQSALPVGGTFTSGVGTFGAALRTAGQQTLNVTDALSHSLTGSAAVIVSAASPSHFTLNAPAGAVPNSPFVLTVIAVDPYNNMASGYAGTVHFTSSDSQALLAANGTLTSGSGVFAALLATLGSQTITATDSVTSSVLGSCTISVTPDPPVLTHFLVTAPSATMAGNAFVFAVTAEDQFNHALPSFSGMVGIGTSDSQAGLPATASLTGGAGYFAAELKTAGSQTITAVDAATSSITGASNAIAVSPAAVTHFAVIAGVPSYPGGLSGPASFASTGVPLGFTVAALDAYGNPVRSYAGTVQFSSSDSAATLPAAATLSGGLGAFTATLMTPGTQTLTVTDTVNNSGPTAITGNSGPLLVRGLVVTGFTPTPTGFTVTFNKPFNQSTVNLYTASSLPDDIILATSGTQVSVRGSVLSNSATSPTSITFIKTNAVSSLGTFNPGSGLLAAGNYTVTLRSFGAGGSGFQDALGSLLDGTNSGSPGANFVFTFSVSTPPVAVGIPDFARGPSNTDALFLPSTIGNGNTFNLIYTNPNTAPSTGTATITFSTTAATLLNNIQNALNALRQISVSASIPNSAVVVINDSATAGANVQITFQGTLAQATNQLLASTTPGVSISSATINAANNITGNGIPIALSSGLNVTSGTFTLQYNPSLLNISGAVSKIAGATFTLSNTINNATSATAVLSLSSPSTISSAATAITIGSLLATVPLSATASYGAKQLLHFSSEQLNGTAGPIPVTNQDGVEVAAYLGDVADKGGAFSLQDATAISAVAGGIASTVAQTIPGFATFPNLDPAIIGDVSQTGAVNFADASLINQQLVSAQVKIPYAPIGLPVTVSAAVVRLAGASLQALPPSAGGSGWQLNTQVNAQQASIGMAKPDWLADDELVSWAQTAQPGLLTSAADQADTTAPGPDGSDPAGLEAYFAREARRRGQ